MFPKNNPLVINELIEYDFGEFEGLTDEELKDNDDFKAWMQGDMNSRPPFGESNAEFIHRVCSAFEKGRALAEMSMEAHFLHFGLTK